MHKIFSSMLGFKFVYFEVSKIILFGFGSPHHEAGGGEPITILEDDFGDGYEGMFGDTDGDGGCLSEFFPFVEAHA